MPTATLTVLDTETTGLPDKAPWIEHPEMGPEIVEYALATWCDGLVSDVECHRVKPRNLHLLPAPEGDTYHTADGFPLRYNAAEWKGAVPWNLDDCHRMRRRLDGQIILGSNPGFDKDRVAWEHQRFQVERPKWFYSHADTGSMAIWLRLQGLIENCKLTTLSSYFGVEHDAHTALGDVLATIAVFEKLFDLNVYHPNLWRDALAEIVECSPDKGMAEFATKALAGEDWR